jgi:hypothetical protein
MATRGINNLYFEEGNTKEFSGNTQLMIDNTGNLSIKDNKYLY